MRPSPSVLTKFGLDGELLKLDGGQGTAWQCDGAVLKPRDIPVEALHWLDLEVRPRLVGANFRSSLPLRSRSGSLVVNGWTAFNFVAGEHRDRHWAEIAQLGRSFAAALGELQRPMFLDTRADVWAQADRFAWAEIEIAELSTMVGITDLLKARQPLSEKSGIIHGDLSGNVLFDSSECPAVIDLSVYWRPVEYSIAILAIDAVCFESAPLSLFATISRSSNFQQFLIRALLFRLATDWMHCGPNTDLTPYRPVIRRLITSK